jgi:hypothetical protein
MENSWIVFGKRSTWEAKRKKLRCVLFGIFDTMDAATGLMRHVVHVGKRLQASKQANKQASKQTNKEDLQPIPTFTYQCRYCLLLHTMPCHTIP